MDKVLQKITEWLKEILVGGVMGNLSGMFDSVNEQVGEIGEQVSLTPAEFSPRVFEMVQGVSESAILPIAGIFLTIVACYELIQMVIDHNNLANFETWTFFRCTLFAGFSLALVSPQRSTPASSTVCSNLIWKRKNRKSRKKLSA